MADYDICPKCEEDFIRGDTCIHCGYKQGAKDKEETSATATAN